MNLKIVATYGDDYTVYAPSGCTITTMAIYAILPKEN